MKIEYNMNSDFFKFYNEAQGVILVKNNILKKPKIKIYNYTQKGFLNLFIIVVIFIISKFLDYIDNCNLFTGVLNIICYIALALIILYFIIFYIGYFTEKNKNHKGILKIDSKGIEDISDDGMVIRFSWDNIKGVVVKQNTVNIITKSQIFLFIDSKNKNILLDNIKKYCPNLSVIDRSK